MPERVRALLNTTRDFAIAAWARFATVIRSLQEAHMIAFRHVVEWNPRARPSATVPQTFH